jgi:hypothetical protein
MALAAGICGFLKAHTHGSVTFRDHASGVQCYLAPDLGHHSMRVVADTCEEAFQQGIQQLPGWEKLQAAEQMKAKIKELEDKKRELATIQRQIDALEAKAG